MIIIIFFKKVDVAQAVEINSYFIVQKLLLSGIEKDFDANPIVTSVNDSKDNKNQIDLEIIKHERNILLREEEFVFYDFNTFRSIENFKKASQQLEDDGIGEFKKQKKNDSQRCSACFKKKNYKILGEDDKIKLVNALMKYQISVATYNKCFKMKRSNSNNHVSEIKKQNIKFRTREISVGRLTR